MNVFDVLKKMSDSADPGLRLAPLSNIISVDQKGSKCTMLIGVQPVDIKNYILKQTMKGGLLLVDGEAFAKAEKSLEVPPMSEEELNDLCEYDANTEAKNIDFPADDDRYFWKNGYAAALKSCYTKIAQLEQKLKS